MANHRRSTQLISLAGTVLLAVAWSYAAAPAAIATSTPPKKSSALKSTAVAKKHRRHHYSYHWKTSSFADDVTDGDLSAGEDSVVRAAAVAALGDMNGTIVAIDPDTGRVLTMVNQKLALSEGAKPCSTIKLATALAALNEGIITKATVIKVSRHKRMNLSDALAHSNNAYFMQLGRQLGFERVSDYAHQLGLGELAGYNIEGEHLGEFPSEAPDRSIASVGRMCAYGDNISMTPLQLGALVSALANGGTLYYLQHPESQEDVSTFLPVVKRQLDIAPLIPELADGMAGAVEYGTARRVRLNFEEEQVLGKTGSCANDGTRYGWFASYAYTSHGKIAVVVFLRGGRPTFGPKAAEIAGRMYQNLYEHSFFAESRPAAADVKQ